MAVLHKQCRVLQSADKSGVLSCRAFAGDQIDLTAAHQRDGPRGGLRGLGVGRGRQGPFRHAVCRPEDHQTLRGRQGPAALPRAQRIRRHGQNRKRSSAQGEPPKSACLGLTALGPAAKHPFATPHRFGH
eukprot:scaffold169719_cov48-Prasinocladus_malaysianus.AAC.1